MNRDDTVDINGCSIHFTEHGDGDPLVLLHGFTGSGDDWKHVFPSREVEGFRTIAVDLRGHGRSTNPSGQFTFRQSALDTLAFLDHLRLARVKAIGMSAGAKTLLHMATCQRDRLEAMILVSGTPYFPPQARAAMAQLSFDALPDIEKKAMRERHVQGDDQIRMLFDQGRALKDSVDDMNFTPPLLGTITARTLIVHGDRDPFYPVELAVEMYRAIPKSELWVVPSAGHGPVFGAQSAAFREKARAFLEAGG